MSNVIFENVSKDYQMGELKIHAAKNVSFEVKAGEFCIVLGPSGAGKTTVLNLLGGMERATNGKIQVARQEVTSLGEDELTDYRRFQIGFVFQFYNLIPNLTALENVELARQVCKSPLDPKEALRLVGLSERVNNFPAQLSGGEQQRVAIARAVCKNPELLLCDEPTGALDSETGKAIIEVLLNISRKMGKTVIVITHNALIAPIADRVIEMKNGQIVSNIVQDAPTKLEEIKW